MGGPEGGVRIASAPPTGTVTVRAQGPFENQQPILRSQIAFIQDLQNYKKLRQEDEFSFSSTDEASPASTLLKLISEGPAHGIHVIATCDSFNNINRFLGRKNLSEFEMRVLFQMSASDSASLIDSPNASTLGLNRALYYNDREGSLETFRPYAPPDNEWVESSVTRVKAG